MFQFALDLPQIKKESKVPKWKKKEGERKKKKMGIIIGKAKLPVMQ